MIKNFMKYYKPHLKLFIMDLICATFVAGIDLLFPYATNKILKVHVAQSEMRTVYLIGIFLLVLYGFRFLFSYIIGYYGHVMGIRIETDMRRDLFNKLETMDYEYFEDQKTGVLMTNLTTHLHDVSEMSHHVPEDLFISSIMLVGSFLILMSINMHLTLVAFISLLLLIVYSISRRRKMLKRFRTARTAQGELNAHVESSITGIRLTKAYTNEEYEKKKFAKTNDTYKQARGKVFREIGLFGSGNDFFIDLTHLVVLIFGGYLVYKGEINYIDLTTFFLYIGFLINPIRRLTNSMEQIQQGFSGIEKFHDIMTTEPKVVSAKKEVKPININGKIEFKAVSFHYSNHEHNHVLSHFNLEIEPGKKIALVGETGVGKSTISKLVPRFYDVSSGEILVDDINVKDYHLFTLRNAIGHVQQDVFIFYGTIKENILYGNPNACFEEVVQAAKNAQIHEFIMSLEDGYDTITGEQGVKLSGGQKQRISIARLFLKNPKILILDEATSSLDNITEKQIQESLDLLSKGKTTITIAHRLSTIKQADEIIVLGKDGIMERGTHEELLSSNGYYYSLYQASISI